MTHKNIPGPHADSRIIPSGIAALPTIFGISASPAKGAFPKVTPASDKGIESIYPAARAVGADKRQFVAPVSFTWR